MAEVLNFPVDKVRPVQSKREGKSAQVMIFPGVQIERGEFSLSDRLPTGTRKRSKRARVNSARDD